LAAHTSDDGWSIEMFFPWSQLGGVQKQFQFNFTRNVYNPEEHSTFAILSGSEFHQPKEFPLARCNSESAI